MGVPKPEFPSTRRLTAREAAVLADEVLGRACAALRNGPPPPPLPRAHPVPPRVVPATRLSATLARWAECLVIAVSALACLMVWLAQHF
jgi:hypothetical protein